MTSKKCNICGETKSLKDFHLHKGRKSGVTESCKDCRNLKMVSKKYNLTVVELLDLREKYNNKCAICGNPPIKGNLPVDHCHTTGKVRGILCPNCNNGLGRFKDNVALLQNAINYLLKNK